LLCEWDDLELVRGGVHGYGIMVWYAILNVDHVAKCDMAINKDHLTMVKN
jgi:hypothetical protein